MELYRQPDWYGSVFCSCLSTGGRSGNVSFSTAIIDPSNSLNLCRFTKQLMHILTTKTRGIGKAVKIIQKTAYIWFRSIASKRLSCYTKMPRNAIHNVRNKMKQCEGVPYLPRDNTQDPVSFLIPQIGSYSSRGDEDNAEERCNQKPIKNPSYRKVVTSRLVP